MVNKDIINFISSEIARGHSMARIKQNLLSQGHSDYDINQAIDYIKGKIKDENPKKHYRRSFSILWIFIGLAISLILVFLLFFFLSKAPKIIERHVVNVSESALLGGVNLNLTRGSRVNLDMDGKIYTIRISKIGSSAIRLSDVINYSIKIGEQKTFDLNNDSFKELYVRLNGLDIYRPKKANLYLEEFVDFACPENWACSGWGSCINGIQQRTCSDINNCGTQKNRPKIQANCSGNSLYNSNNDSLQINCNYDFICFIDSSNQCNKSKVIFQNEQDSFGVITRSTIYMELRGWNSGKCVYYEKTMNASIRYSDELIQEMISGGLTQNEINQAQSDDNNNIKQFIGVWHECSFDQLGLTEMLGRWNLGEFSSDVNCNPPVNNQVSCTYGGGWLYADCHSGFEP